MKNTFCLQKLAALAADVQQRCFSASALSFAAQKVAMSKFDSTSYLPYDKLEANLKVVRKRQVNMPEILYYRVHI